MDLIQYKGPFKAGETIEVPAVTGYTYVHIGIQVPKQQPISVPVTTVSNDGKTTTWTGDWRPMRGNPIVQINEKDYQLNACDVLEFDGLSEIAWTIRFLHSLPPEAIIDIVRKS